MGLRHSRERSEQRWRRQVEANEYPTPGRRRQRRGFFRARLPTATTLSIAPLISHRNLRRTLYSSNLSFGPNYPYPPMPLYSPMQYNNYLPNGYMFPQAMVAPQQRIAPAMPGLYAMPPPASPGMMMPSPYIQQQQQQQQPAPVQPVFSNYAAPAPIPAAPNVYPSAPARLMTDWTGGGIISPGFLGPPI